MDEYKLSKIEGSYDFSIKEKDFAGYIPIRCQILPKP